MVLSPFPAMLALLGLLIGHVAADYSNPIIWEDLPDLDIIRVNTTYYYSASSFHQSPGAPILQSEDLVNWEYIGHSVPTLDFGNNYNMQGGTAYVKGIWASSIGFRKSNGLFYWIGCIDFATSYVYTAPAAAGPWKQAAKLKSCYYDAGLLIDDDDTMYVAYGNQGTSVAQLSESGLSEVKSQKVFTPGSIGTLEGSRFYHIGKYYYIWTTRPANAQYVLRSTSPWGPYESKVVVDSAKAPIPNAGFPHQGALVDSPDGKQWYYVAFLDSYPMGRSPTIAPVTISSDGWPTLSLTGNQWPASGPNPLPAKPVASHFGRDEFASTQLGPQWEWSHNPDTSAFKVGNGLQLSTVTVTQDYYQARNSLTRRIIGPKSVASMRMDVSAMQVGDRAGLGVVRDQTALLVVEKGAQGYTASMVSGVNLSNSGWKTSSTGTTVGTPQSLDGPDVYLRATADVTPGPGRTASFEISSDGTTWKPIGKDFTLTTQWQYFLGYRFGIFNYATKQTGGSVTVKWFDIEAPGTTTTRTGNVACRSARPLASRRKW